VTRSNRRRIQKLRKKIEKLGAKVTGHDYVKSPTTDTSWFPDALVCVVYWTDPDGNEWAQYKQFGSRNSDGFELYSVSSLIKALEVIVSNLETKAIWK
jgi:hypothetical protein